MTKFRRMLLTPLAALALVLGATVAFAAPANATGAGVCYNKGNYSFKYVQSSAHYYYYIDAWGRTGCPGTSLVRGQVWFYTSGSHTNQWQITAYDNYCDNYGFVEYTQVKSVSSTGCGTSPSKYIAFSELNGKPKNFWINWHGVNSEAHPLP